MTIWKLFKKHGISYIAILSAILFFYWWVYRGISESCGTPETLSNVIQNTITSGLTGVSIALPLTVGILGYAVKEKIECIDFLFCACVFFLVSTVGSLWNLFRLPGLVTTLNIANDYKTAVLQIIQLYSLLYGFLYLIVGAWKIVKA